MENNDIEKIPLKKLRDPKFYLENFVKIKGKKAGQLIPFILNEAQKDLFNTVRKRNRVIILKSRQIGFCQHPSTKVLTSNLEWVTLDEIKVGQSIIAVDENIAGGKGSARKIQTAIVENKFDVYDEAIKLTMDDGSELIATPSHKFLFKDSHLCKMVWKRVDELKIGDETGILTKMWDDIFYEDGWFSGMIDGEGSLSKSSRSGVCLAVSQVAGRVWDRLVNYAESNNINYRVDIDKRIAGTSSKLGSKEVNKLIISNMLDLLYVMGKTSPSRFKDRKFWEGKRLEFTIRPKVVKIENLGKQRMIDLQTSKRTYIANGFVSHNSTAMVGYYYHDTITTPGTNTALIGYNSDLTSELLDKVKTFYSTTPSELRPTIQYNSKYEISFPRINSKILVLPSTETVGRGYTLSNVLCISGETEVFKKNGFTDKVKNIKDGDFIVNGSGGISKVKKVIKKNNNDKLLKINIVGNDPLTLTEDHMVLVRGDKGSGFKPTWKTAGNLTDRDRIGYPSDIDYNVNGHKECNYFWSKIKNIEIVEREEFVYDIVMDRSPHSFLTKSGVVHNCTELAFWEKADEKMATLEASVPIDGRLVIESTPGGVGNLYHRMWMADDNDYAKKQYGWWWGYSQKDIETIRRRLNDPRKFAQEYGLEFLSSGRNVFDVNIIKEQRKNVLRVGDHVSFGENEEFEVKEEDKLRMYKPPQRDHFYVAGVDTSEGVDGGDYSVAHVWDRTTGEEVAMFRGLLPPDTLGVKLDKWGRKYNNALMVVEINNHGLTTLTILKQLLYPSLYFRPAKFEAIGSPNSDKLGWKTTKVTRPLLIDDFAQACRENSLTIHSKELLDEMSVFVYNDKGNMAPILGYHDDCIFAAAIGLQGFKVLYDKKLEQLDYNDFLPKSYAY